MRNTRRTRRMADRAHTGFIPGQTSPSRGTDGSWMCDRSLTDGVAVRNVGVHGCPTSLITPACRVHLI